MVDLSLASSYVPAFVCMLKSVVVCGLGAFLIPLGGTSSLCTLLLLDWIFINSDFILDVNALVAVVLWAQLSNYDRFHRGIHTLLSMLIGATWVVFALSQLVRPGTLKHKIELYVYSGLAILMSFTYLPHEPLHYSIIRGVGYNVVCFVQIYWQIAASAEEPLVVTLLRNGAILLSIPPVAFVGSLCLVGVIAFRLKPITVTVANDVDMEAAALREALASRKEKSAQ